MAQALVYTKHEATGRLDELGLTEPLLREAVEWTYAYHVAEVTENEPPYAQGMIMYIKLTRALRDRLLLLGWQRDNSRNYSTTINPDRSLAIAVAGGDESTGREDESPSTISRKGKATKDAIIKGQMAFDYGDTSRSIQLGGPQIWILLVHVDPETDELRLELARPYSVTGKDCISKWQERIILQAIPLISPPLPDVETTDEIGIDIRRRSGDAQ
ncbi:MAG: hypothetical protein Q8J63_08965 [Candidatus Aquicultor sp.]|nr:hypothetical protein [Candidatus Aquicultor sp.]